MVFGFVIFRLPGHLVFFDLLIIVFKVFEKIWIWYFLLKQTQIRDFRVKQALGFKKASLNRQ